MTINKKKYLNEGGPGSGRRPDGTTNQSPGYQIAKGRIKKLKGQENKFALAQTHMVHPTSMTKGIFGKSDQYKRVVMGLAKRMNPKAVGAAQRTDYRSLVARGKQAGAYHKLYGGSK